MPAARAQLMTAIRSGECPRLATARWFSAMALATRPNDVQRKTAYSAAVRTTPISRMMSRSTPRVAPGSGSTASVGRNEGTLVLLTPYRSTAAACRVSSTPRVAITRSIGDEVRIGRRIRNCTATPNRTPTAVAAMTDRTAGQSNDTRNS
jgi:hypothetical protein